MSTTQKFKVMIVIKDRHGNSKTIYPIIEASSDMEAKRLAQAQYPDAARIGTVTKTN